MNEEEINANVSNNDLIGVKKFRQLALKQVQTFEFALKSLEQINDDVLRYLCIFYRNTNDDSNKFEIRSSLYLIKQLLVQSLDKFKQNMNETNCLNNTIENHLLITNTEYVKIKNELNVINNTAKQWNTLTCELTSTNMQFEMNKKLQDKLIENLNIQNLKYKEKINELQKKLDLVNNSTPAEPTTTTKGEMINEEEFIKLKEAFEDVKIERKKLKYEKLELLNQTKELYKTIEAKENEIRDFLRHYESKTRETANSVKRLIESKTDIEKEKTQLQTQNQSLLDQNSQLKFLLESKEATIKKLQKQLHELKSKSPRYSYGKESDYGYISGKSRDTLCNSATMDTISRLTTTTTTTTGTATEAALSTSCHTELLVTQENIEDDDDDKIIECETTTTTTATTITKDASYLRESISTDCISSKNTNNNNNNKSIENENIYATSTRKTVVALNTSPTASTSSYTSSSVASSSSSSDEQNNKDLHASLPIMAHSTIDEYSTKAHLSVSLNIPKKNEQQLQQQQSDTPATSVSSSTSSVILSNSFCSSSDRSNANLTPPSFDKQAIEKWQQNTIKEWLEHIGMLPIHVKNCLKYIRNGKALTSINENELEKIFFLSNQMHKRKIKLALDDLKASEKCKYKNLSKIDNKWICRVWLKEIGLKQYQPVFASNLVDGRLLASLQRKDLEKNFNIRKRIHQTSILLGIELLKKYDFDIEHLRTIRFESENKDITLWTNESFIDWLKLVNLHSYTDNLSESGLHGAFISDSSFNVDSLYEALRVDEIKHQNIKKILEDEIKLIKKSKFPKQDSAFIRSLSSFRNNDKRIFTFRGSLGRALGKKIKRDISSPLIDDDTYKRLEFNHKLNDVKSSYTISNSAV